MVFVSKYVSFCGNDYFTIVMRKYKFVDNNKLIISVNTVSYSGEWEKPTEHRKSKDKETILLTKQN